MSLRKLVVVLVVVCVCAVAATLLIFQLVPDQGSGTGSGSTEADKEAPAYAYITSDELVVMRADQAVARVSRVFDPADPHQNKAVWTHGGDYIALLSDAKLRQEDPSATELIFVNTHTGTQNRLRCSDCGDLAPVERNAVVASINGLEEGSNFLKFNLDSPGVGQPLDLSVGTSLLASTQDYLLAQYGITPGGSSKYVQKLDLVKLDNSFSKDLGYFDAASPLAAVENTPQGGGRIAVALKPSSAECIADSPISILSTTGEMVSTDMSAANPPGYIKDAQGGLEVNDLWWDLSGQLHAAIASWTCDNTKQLENDKEVLVSPSSLWKLDGQKWVKEDTSPATMVRQVGQDTRIVLVIPDCIGPVTRPDFHVYCNTGIVYRDQNGKRFTISNNVISILSPPMYQQ